MFTFMTWDYKICSHLETYDFFESLMFTDISMILTDISMILIDIYQLVTKHRQ